MKTQQQIVGFGVALLMAGVVPQVLALEQQGATGQTSQTSQTGQTESRAAAMSAPQETSLTGAISAVDFKVNSLRMTSPGGKEVTLMLDPKATTVWQGGKAGALTQLKVGERVTVRYAAREGKPMAKSIEIAAASTMGSSTGR